MLQNSKSKGIDFEKKRKNKTFIPAFSKYIDVPDLKVCWYYGMSEHLRPLCSQREHLWDNVPSNVKASVHETIPNIPHSAKPSIPVKMIWVWIPKVKI